MQPYETYENVVASLDEVKNVVRAELTNAKISIDLNNNKFDRFDKSDVDFGDKINSLKMKSEPLGQKLLGVR